MEVTYPISYDPDGKIFSDFTIKGAGVTRNIVVDKNGKIVFLTRLYEEKEFNSMIQVIKTLIINYQKFLPKSWSLLLTKLLLKNWR